MWEGFHDEVRDEQEERNFENQDNERMDGGHVIHTFSFHFLKNI